ncbi:NAD(P)-binding oxidoreductase [Saccharopolyspora sp. NPDC047091]|uniref:NAD(P)-dependent oxidoreductase n=1 Tax=Saccharopolyspora sp. NPDC047091 TaxID=3155924 RepID=UPI0033E459A4
MQIVVLGATGRTGGAAVEHALDRGHQVTAYARNPDAITPRPGLAVAGGAVDDVPAMTAAFAGHDAVVSCLGARVGAGYLRHGTDFQRRSLPRILDAIEAAAVPRFVLLSSLGIGDTARKQSFVPRLFARTIAKRLFDDKLAAERDLPRCAADWTAVYPVTLRTGPADEDRELAPLDEVTAVPGMPVLTFATVAAALVDLVPERDGPRRLVLTRRGAWR